MGGSSRTGSRKSRLLLRGCLVCSSYGLKIRQLHALMDVAQSYMRVRM